ncbi:unnamed protein product [Trichobilharzia regenti]|nr:unnamed protein product [Trichobilharzia regenti]
MNNRYFQILLAIWTFQWIVLFPKECLSVEEIELRLNMREEIAPFTRIGSVISSLPPNLRSQLHFLTDSTFFTVTPTTVICELKASIFVTNKAAGEFAASVALRVEVQDQNDNRPTFSSEIQTVQLSEGTSVGTLISIVPATDADIDPENQIQRYTLVEPTGTFKLDLSGLPAVCLELLRPLDREQIQVLDENDNSPVLQNTRFNKRLIENTAVGAVVMQLNATDPDSGERGRVLYSFHGNVDADLIETFELVRDTGEIRLKRPLAANIRDIYEFKVVACDAVNRACSGNENSTADITFTVQDQDTSESNSKPFDEPKSGDGLSILENSPPSQIAVLTVRDDDTGENSKVSCSLNQTSDDMQSNVRRNKQDFVLTPSAPGIFSLRTARVFDYEVESTVRTTIVCHDYGKPQRLTSARVITVQIIDVNEFQPEFSRRVYVGRVPENAPPGMEILTTTAIDRDRAAVLNYQFAASPSLSSPSRENGKQASNSDSFQSDDGVNQYFVIEPETGIIRTSQWVIHFYTSNITITNTTTTTNDGDDNSNNNRGRVHGIISSRSIGENSSNYNRKQDNRFILLGLFLKN